MCGYCWGLLTGDLLCADSDVSDCWLASCYVQILMFQIVDWCLAMCRFWCLGLLTVFLLWVPMGEVIRESLDHTPTSSSLGILHSVLSSDHFHPLPYLLSVTIPPSPVCVPSSPDAHHAQLMRSRCAQVCNLLEHGRSNRGQTPESSHCE